MDSLLMEEKAVSNLLLNEELGHRFCFNVCKSGTLVGVGFFREKRYVESYKKLKFSLLFLDYMEEFIRELDDSSQKNKKYKQDLNNLRVLVLETLLLVSKATQIDVEWYLPTLYKDLLQLVDDGEEENGKWAALYMEISVFFLKKSNFGLSFKFCEMAQRFYSSSFISYPFDLLLSERLKYIITFLSKPTQIISLHNPFRDMVNLYLRSDWVALECSFVDLLGPQNLSESILDALLTRTEGVKGFWFPLQVKRAKILWERLNPDMQETWYVQVVRAMDMIETPPQSFIDVLEDLTWVLVELRGKTDAVLQVLINKLDTWLSAEPPLPLAHRGRLQLMMGRLELIDVFTTYQAKSHLESAQQNLMESYGENHPFQNILASENNRVLVQLQKIKEMFSETMDFLEGQ